MVNMVVLPTAQEIVPGSAQDAQGQNAAAPGDLFACLIAAQIQVAQGGQQPLAQNGDLLASIPEPTAKAPEVREKQAEMPAGVDSQAAGALLAQLVAMAVPETKPVMPEVAVEAKASRDDAVVTIAVNTSEPSKSFLSSEPIETKATAASTPQLVISKAEAKVAPQPTAIADEAPQPEEPVAWLPSRMKTDQPRSADPVAPLRTGSIPTEPGVQAMMAEAVSSETKPAQTPRKQRVETVTVRAASPALTEAVADAPTEGSADRAQDLPRPGRDVSPITPRQVAPQVTQSAPESPKILSGFTSVLEIVRAKTALIEAPVLQETSIKAETDRVAPSKTPTGDEVMVPVQATFDGTLREVSTARAQGKTQTPEMQLHRRVIDQVAQEVRLQRFEGGHDLVVKLNPPELGTLRLHITQSEAGMTSQIHASSDQVRGLLQAHLPMLADALSNAGLDMDKISVTSGPHFGALMQDTEQGMARQQSHGRGNRSAHSHEAATVQVATELTSGVSAYYGSAGYSWLA